MKIEAYQGPDYFLIIKDGLSVTINDESFRGSVVPVLVAERNPISAERLIGAIANVQVGAQYATDFLEDLAVDGIVVQSDVTKKVLTRQNGWWMHGSRPLTSLEDFEPDTESWTMLAV